MILLVHLFKLFLYTGTILLTGRATLTLINPAHRHHRSITDGLPLSFLLGTLTLTIVSLPFSLLNIHTGLWTLALSAGIPFGLNAVLWHKKTTPQPAVEHIQTYSNYGLVALSVGIFLVCLNFILTAAFPQFDIDMVGHILMKAKILAETTYPQSIYFNDPVFASAHGNYPPLSVFLSAYMIQLGLTSVADYLAMNYFILILIALTLHKALSTRIPPAQSAAWTFIFMSTAEYLKNQYIISSTDILLSLALFLCALELLHTEKTNLRESVLFATLCATAMLIKNDALVFIGIISVLHGIKERRWPFTHLLVMSMILGPWAIYRLSLPDPGNGGEFVLRHLDSLLSLSTLSQAGQAAWLIISTSWNKVFLLAVLLWPFLMGDKTYRPLMLLCLLTWAIYFLMIWSMIPVTPGFASGLLRVVGHIYPLAIFLTAVSLARVGHKNDGEGNTGVRSRSDERILT